MDSTFIKPEGPGYQRFFTPNELGLPPSTPLPALGTVNGSLLSGFGSNLLALSAQSSVNATLYLYLYCDTAGLVLCWSGSSSVSAGSSNYIYSPGNIPFSSFKCAIVSTSATAGTCQANGALAQA